MAKANELLTREEIAQLIERSDARGALAVLVSWGLIAGSFVMLARVPHPGTFVVALIILGGRQLALSVLMHEAAHGTLFRTRFANDVVTDWLCARPVFTDVVNFGTSDSLSLANASRCLMRSQFSREPRPSFFMRTRDHSPCIRVPSSRMRRLPFARPSCASETGSQ